MSGQETGPANEQCPIADDFDPFDGMPHAFFELARKEYPVFYHPGIGAYVLTKYEDCRRLLGDRSGLVSASAALMQHLNVEPSPRAMQILAESGFNITPSMADEDGDDHKLHRASVQPAFTPSRIGSLAGFIRRQMVHRLERIVDAGRADIVNDIIYEVPALVILHMMGVPEDQMGMVKNFRGPWAVFVWGDPDEQVQIDTATMMGEFGKWARGIVVDRLANPGDDAVSEMIANLKGKGAFERDRLIVDSMTLNMPMAGHETTVNTMAYGIVHLLQNRDQWEDLVANPSLVPNAAEEILRYSTGVPTWRQRATADLTFQGITIPKDSVVYAAINSANRDEDVFGSDAEQFNIRRANANKHITFGTGPHTCMGNHLAKLEICIMLEELVRYLPHMEIVVDQDFVFSPNTSQRGPERVDITWDVRGNPIR